MYEKTSLADLETRDVEDIEPDLKAVGYRLRPEEMRPSVWEFAEGETNNWHRHEEQEELYYVLSGTFLVTVESEEKGESEDGAVERETFELGEDEVVVMPPETWRQFEALDAGRLLVVGAPSVKDDGITGD
ncbi:cupin domain-containing protein [Halorussus lipolyticus]|uniref:cupin domain-containing protein n=1 Tax=Halorussus lipolyticus TaxID=3034024 RepID=UPI0023E8575A|nr:cupin domain-containing protein [Halorussus sp. DT80]